MRRILMVMAAAAVSAAGAAEPGFTDLFDGRTLDGWKVNGGSAEFSVENGEIVGRCVPDTPGNTFLCTEKEYGNFIFRIEYKIESGNSGVQFRSSLRPDANLKHGNCVFGYQAEITVDGADAARIYDEGRRGHRHGLVWLDRATPQARLDAAKAAFRRDGWNEMEIQCAGPSIKTWINGRKVVDIFDDAQQRGIFGLQVHAGKGCTVRWRNVRVKELPPSPAWEPFFASGADGAPALAGAHYVLPGDWSFGKDAEGAFLRGAHAKGEARDGLVVSDADYADFAARVSYRLSGGNSALYFRAAEDDVPWTLRGFQNEIAGTEKDGALWHTQGKTVPGRGWVAANDEIARKVRDANGWNTVSTIAVGNRIVNRLNGFETVDIVDPPCEKSGRLGLQLHGGADDVALFRKWEVMRVAPWMLECVYRDADGARLVQMPSSCSTPDGMCVDPKGRLVVAGANCADHSRPGAVYLIDEPGAAPRKWFDIPACPGSDYTQPMGMAFGPDGELYVCDCQAPGKGRLLRFAFNADGSVASCETVAEGLANANGVKYLAGRLYVTQAMMPAMEKDGKGYSAIYMFSANDRNVKVSNTDGDPQFVFGDPVENKGRKVGLNGVAVDRQGRLYTGNYGDGHVWRLEIGADGRVAKSEKIALPTPENGLVSPDGMCVDEAGNVYIADMFAGAVIRITPCGKASVLTRGAGAPGAPSALVRPSEPCVWRGRLYVANFGSTTLFELPL